MGGEIKNKVVFLRLPFKAKNYEYNNRKQKGIG